MSFSPDFLLNLASDTVDVALLIFSHSLPPCATRGYQEGVFFALGEKVAGGFNFGRSISLRVRIITRYWQA